jgi:prepilin-type N-terminal cleavage/methylation domain-containing protein
MKKNKKGFTLIELLAVIVVLGVIMSIAGTAVLKQKKKANIKEAKSLENTITKIGEDLYTHESMVGKTVDGYFYNKYKSLKSGESIYISLTKLANAGYIKSASIANPSGDGTCKGYLSVKKTDEGPSFKGHICCPNLYTTDNEITDCSRFNELNSSDVNLTEQ